jgi:putative transposase
MGRRKRRRVERADDWEQLEILCAWDEQMEYERIRPLVLFGDPVPERATETGTSERTLYRRIAGFELDGMRSLFGSPPAKRRVLPASLRRLIVDLKAEHPALNLNEIARICYVRSGRKPHLATVRGVLDEEPLPIKAFRRFEPYHETEEGRERRKAVVALHYEGWADKSIARYLGVDRSTVYRVLRRWMEEGPAGLEDKKRGRPSGVQKVDLRAMLEVRRRQENPELGAFRMRAALEQVGIHLSTRTIGRILKANREAEGLSKPGGVRTRRRRCPSRRLSATRYGPPTCATSTTPSPRRDRPT